VGYHGGMIAQKYRNSKYNFYLLVSGPAKDGASLWKLQRSFDLLRSLRMTILIGWSEKRRKNKYQDPGRCEA